MADEHKQPPAGEVEEELNPEEETESAEEVETEEEDSPEVEEEQSEPTVALSEYSNTKELLSRFADDLLSDEDKLAEFAEKDPKALKRLQAQFPKKFKDVVIPNKAISDDDIEELVQRAVEKRLAESTRSDKLDAFRRDLKMSEIEFEDIKDDIEAKAEQLMKAEIAHNFQDAILQAYKLIDPVKAKHLLTKQVVEEMSERSSAASAGSSKTQGGKKEYPEAIMKNYKTAGFSSPAEMAKYMDDDISVIDYMVN